MSATEQEVLAAIRARVSEIRTGADALPSSALNRMTSLVNLDLDSMEQLELLACVEDDFSIDIPDDRAHRIRTVGDLLDLVSELTAESAT